MFGEKIWMLVAMIYIAIVIASLLKLEKITFKNISISIFMPIIIFGFLIDFSLFVWNKEINKLSLGKKFPSFFRLIIFEIQCFPQIHTEIVTILKSSSTKVNENLTDESKLLKDSFQKLRYELNPLLEV